MCPPWAGGGPPSSKWRRPARGVEGHLKLTCVKARNGTWQKGALVADIDVKSNPEGTDVHIAVKRSEQVCVKVRGGEAEWGWGFSSVDFIQYLI